MRVVLDTGILLAALITFGTPPDLVYRAWRKRAFELITSEWQLDELRRVSAIRNYAGISNSTSFCWTVDDAVHFSGLSFYRVGEDAMTGNVAMREGDEIRKAKLTYRRSC